MRAPFVPGVVVGVMLMSTGGLAVVAAQETAPKAGLELFSVMVPAYKSPRCVNCHGMVNPETGDHHEGDKVIGFKMGGDANQALSFVDKTPRELCRQTRILTAVDSGDTNALLAHLTGDLRIDEAFEGHRGIDGRSIVPVPDAEPPPMSQSDFDAAVGNWVTAGASCSGPGWHGTLTYEQTRRSSLSQPAPGMTHTLYQTASTRQVWVVEPKANPDDGLTADWTGDVTGDATETTVITGTTSCTGRLQVPYSQTTTLNTATSGQGRAIVDVLIQDLGKDTFYIQSMPPAGVQQGQMVGTTHTEQSGGCAPIPPTSDTQTHPYPIVNDAVSTQARSQTDDSGNLVLQGSQTQQSPDGSVSVTITWNLTNP